MPERVNNVITLCCNPLTNTKYIKETNITNVFITQIPLFSLLSESSCASAGHCHCLLFLVVFNFLCGLLFASIKYVSVPFVNDLRLVFWKKNWENITKD